LPSFISATGHFETLSKPLQTQEKETTHKKIKLRREDVSEMKIDEKFAAQSPSSSSGFSVWVPKLAQPRDYW
jgi:hypothetical protein